MEKRGQDCDSAGGNEELLLLYYLYSTRSS
jgi:hypothetical protein